MTKYKISIGVAENGVVDIGLTGKNLIRDLSKELILMEHSTDVERGLIDLTMHCGKGTEPDELHLSVYYKKGSSKGALYMSEETMEIMDAITNKVGTWFEDLIELLKPLL